MVTRADVARSAGVSEATVSYVLSRKRTISEPTRLRVLAAMDELGYAPNAVARALAGRRTHVIALLMPTQERSINYADMEYLMGGAQAAREAGYRLLIWPTADGHADDALELARDGLIAGVLLMEVRVDDDRVDVLSRAGIPVGLIGRRGGGVGDRIYADRDFDGALTIAVVHLRELGHTRIAFVSGSQRSRDMRFAAVVRAEEAFSAAMSAVGLVGNIFHADGSIASGKRLAIEIAAMSSRPTAIIGLNADDTHGLVIGAHAAGLSVPDDLSIVSIGTPSAFAEGTEPALTTVSPPAQAIGAAATRMLIRSIEQPRDEPVARHLFAGELVIRGSSCPPPS